MDQNGNGKSIGGSQYSEFVYFYVIVVNVLLVMIFYIAEVANIPSKLFGSKTNAEDEQSDSRQMMEYPIKTDHLTILCESDSELSSFETTVCSAEEFLMTTYHERSKVDTTTFHVIDI